MTSPLQIPLHPGYQLRRDLRRHWALFLGLAVALSIWCAVDVARRAIVDPQKPHLHMTDFTVYTEAGAAFFDGREPYDVSNIRGWKYLYPPLFALLVAPLAALSPPWQATVWFGLSSLMALGCYVECRLLLERLSKGTGTTDRLADDQEQFWIPHWEMATWILAPLFPILNCLQRGQMGLAILYPLLLGFRLVCRGSSWPALLGGGILLALPIALKVTPALPVACVLATLMVAAGLRRRDQWTDGANTDRGAPRFFGLQTVHPSTTAEISNQSPDGSPKTKRRLALFDPSSPSAPINLVEPTQLSSFGRAVWPLTGVLAGGALFLFLLPAALLGWNRNLEHLQTWHQRVGSRINDVRSDDFGENVASFRNQSLMNALFRCGNWVSHQFLGGPDDVRMDVTRGEMPMDAPLVGHILTIVRIAALLALGGVIFIAGRTGAPGLAELAFGLAGVAALVVSPVSRGHYYVFWLPAVVLLPRWLIIQGHPRRARWMATIPAGLTLLHYVLLPYAGRVGLLGIGAAAWYFAACYQTCTIRTASNALEAAQREETPEDLPLARAA
ncbi:MAG: glycosyltransferase 87 family protein [Planctomycetales bacterium]